MNKPYLYYWAKAKLNQLMVLLGLRYDAHSYLSHDVRQHSPVLLPENNKRRLYHEV